MLSSLGSDKIHPKMNALPRKGQRFLQRPRGSISSNLPLTSSKAFSASVSMASARLLFIPLLHLLLSVSVPASDVRENLAVYLVQVDGEEPVGFQQKTSDDLSSKSTSFEFLSKRLVHLHDELLESTLDEGMYQKLYSYNHIMNGFAVHTTPSQAKKLAKSPRVKLVERDRQAKLMTTHTPSFLGLAGIWAQQGGEKTAGEGILIGVIDSGINPNHPSFANDPENPFVQDWRPQFKGHCEVSLVDGSFCNGKIVSARHFSAGAEAVFHFNSSREMSPFDEVGHGTHVASVAAGNWGVPVAVDGFNYGIASGMAPRSRISVYKAIYPEGGTMADVICAIDHAARDGVDILILSIGPDEAPKDSSIFLSAMEICLLFARRAGVFVVQAGGNKGPNKSTTVSVSPWAFTAAAGTTDRKFQATVELHDCAILHGVGLSGPTSKKGNSPFKKLVAAKDAISGEMNTNRSQTYAEECQHPEALNKKHVKGAIVICNFSTGFFNRTSTLTSILNTAKALGFSGFILAASPLLGDFIAEPLPFSVPGIMIPKVSDAQILLRYYEENTRRDADGKVVWHGRAKIYEGRTAFYGEEAPKVAKFSSRGPNVVDILKPDILAPGYQIWAAWSPTSTMEPFVQGDNFALLSGTSMAAPHVAGIAALIKQVHSDWDPSEISSAISTTASRYDSHGMLIFSQGSDPLGVYPSTPFDRGAGLVNPSKAVDPGLVFPAGFDDYVCFLCSLPGVDREMVRRATGSACLSSNSDFSPVDLNLPSVTMTSLRGARKVRRRVKNVGFAPETYLVSVLQPGGVKVGVEPRVFRLGSTGIQDLEIEVRVKKVFEGFSFGEIVLVGSSDHVVRLPLSISLAGGED